MGIEGYHNYTICLRLKREIKKFQIWKRLIKNHRRGYPYWCITHQASQRMVRHISRGIAKGVGAAVAENDRRPRRLHGDQHGGHGYVRQIHHHSESIHLQHDTLETSENRGGIIGPSFPQVSHRFLPFSFPPPLMMPYLKLSFKDIRPR